MEIDNLTEQGLAKLLARLGDDPERAGAGYEELRLMLIKFFEWRDSCFPEDDADETINRVIRRLDAGEEQIQNLTAYCFGVARLVHLEMRRLRDQRRVDLEELPPLVALAPAHEQDDKRLVCFRSCLESLPAESRKFILLYYRDENRARIDHRKLMAESLSVSQAALRRRAQRLRDKIEACVNKCVRSQQTA